MSADRFETADRYDVLTEIAERFSGSLPSHSTNGPDRTLSQPSVEKELLRAFARID
jgi:hypothetical protein